MASGAGATGGEVAAFGRLTIVLVTVGAGEADLAGDGDTADCAETGPLGAVLHAAIPSAATLARAVVTSFIAISSPCFWAASPQNSFHEITVRIAILHAG
jgi:hypothetical protein